MTDWSRDVTMQSSQDVALNRPTVSAVWDRANEFRINIRWTRENHATKLSRPSGTDEGWVETGWRAQRDDDATPTEIICC